MSKLYEFITNIELPLSAMTRIVADAGIKVVNNTDICATDGWMQHTISGKKRGFKSISGAKRSVRAFWSDYINDYVIYYDISGKYVDVQVAIVKKD